MILVVAVFNLIERALHLSGAYSLLNFIDGKKATIGCKWKVVSLMLIYSYLPFCKWSWDECRRYIVPHLDN